MTPPPEDDSLPQPARPLTADPARQAVASITGTLHQIWWSIDAWLRLYLADEVIYLEGAEDVDRGGEVGATASQPKPETSGVSPSTLRAREVLANFWRLLEGDSTRVVVCHFVTTASATREADADFDALRGL